MGAGKTGTCLLHIDTVLAAAGHRAVHAGALGAYRLQFDASFHCWNGTVHGLRVHASAHHGNIALL